VLTQVGFTIIFNNPSLNQAWSEQQQQTEKGLVVSGVHSPELKFEKNYTNVKSAAQTGITHPVIAGGMVENHTIATMKLNTTQFQHIDKSQFIKAPEFAQISGYINTPNNNSPITLSSLRGKVVLVYIWTYTCINSIRPMPFFVTTPLLDYDVSDSYKNNNELKICLSNFGIAPAKNVIISVDANKSSVEFLNFTTEPLLSKSDNNLTN
jgi:hypothetical protein